MTSVASVTHPLVDGERPAGMLPVTADAAYPTTALDSCQEIAAT